MAKLPTLHKVQVMQKDALLKVLYYCPESEFYYGNIAVMHRMAEEDRKEIMKKVKDLINRVAMAKLDRISEVPREQEMSSREEKK